jgi:hypothetical protein
MVEAARIELIAYVSICNGSCAIFMSCCMIRRYAVNSDLLLSAGVSFRTSDLETCNISKELKNMRQNGYSEKNRNKSTMILKSLEHLLSLRERRKTQVVTLYKLMNGLISSVSKVAGHWPDERELIPDML